MKFRLSEANIDLGLTPIENIFIDNYLSIASGNAIKLYIYAYKKAYEHSNIDFQEENLAKELGMSMEEFMDAMNYWLIQGVLAVGEEDAIPIFQFHSLRELMLGVSHIDENNDKQEEEIGYKDEGPALDSNLKMFDSIEEIIGTKLTPNEIEKIIAHIDEFNQDKDLIVKGFEYSDKTTAKRNVNYVLSILRNLAIDGIFTLEDFEKLKEKKGSEKEPVKRPKAGKKRRLKNVVDMSTDQINDILKRKLMDDIKKARGVDNDSGI